MSDEDELFDLSDEEKEFLFYQRQFQAKIKFLEEISNLGFLVQNRGQLVVVKKFDDNSNLEYEENFNFSDDAFEFIKNKISEKKIIDFKVVAYLNRGLGWEPFNAGSVQATSQEEAQKQAREVARQFLLNDKDLDIYVKKYWDQVEVRVVPAEFYKN